MNNDISEIGKVVSLPTSRVLPKQPASQLKEMDKPERLSESNKDELATKDKQADKNNVLTADFGQLKKVVSEANAVFQETQRNLQFKVDDDTKKMVVKIVDKESGEVIRQIPSEEMLALIKRMQEIDTDPQGLVLQDKA